MAEPALVAEGVKAMCDATTLPVTVKHRIGIDRGENYGFVRDFVGTVAAAGCSVFVVHARNAWLQGLSPKENRDVPPLRHEFVYQLKRDFPHLTIVLNGGVQTEADIAWHLRHVDGVMVGRWAYHEPWAMATWDERFLGGAVNLASRESIEADWVDYLQGLHECGQPHGPRPCVMRWAYGTAYRGHAVGGRCVGPSLEDIATARGDGIGASALTRWRRHCSSRPSGRVSFQAWGGLPARPNR